MAVTWQPGMKITADRLNSITATWTAWTPTWSTSSGNHLPSFGNATIDCAYAQTGDLVTFRMSITFGSTTDFGTSAGTTDNWTFSLPVTAAESGINIGYWNGPIGSAKSVGGPVQLFSASLLELYIGNGHPDGTSTTNQGIADSLTPDTWASGNRFVATGVYAAAPS